MKYGQAVLISTMLLFLNAMIWIAQPDTKPGLFMFRVAGTVVVTVLPVLLCWVINGAKFRRR